MVLGSASTPEKKPEPSAIPRHVAIIMDGNGRWAKARHLPRIEGHRQGAKTVRLIVEESRRLGIRYLTLFAFSSENWGRPEAEVSALMGLFAQHLESEQDLLIRNDIRLRAIGDLGRLPAKVQDSLGRVMNKTLPCKGMDLLIAVSYGARDEITSAVRTIASEVKAGTLQPDEITKSTISAHLYAPDVPDPDLLIRTSNELRISNFLLWQLAYAEIVVSSLFWPEFGKDEFYRCLEVFGSRSRRFGLTQEQQQEKTKSETKGD
jgi:undecaprenyl diphosphate synthase